MKDRVFKNLIRGLTYWFSAGMQIGASLVHRRYADLGQEIKNESRVRAVLGESPSDVIKEQRSGKNGSIKFIATMNGLLYI